MEILDRLHLSLSPQCSQVQTDLTVFLKIDVIERNGPKCSAIWLSIGNFANEINHLRIPSATNCESSLGN